MFRPTAFLSALLTAAALSVPTIGLAASAPYEHADFKAKGDYLTTAPIHPPHHTVQATGRVRTMPLIRLVRR